MKGRCTNPNSSDIIYPMLDHVDKYEPSLTHHVMGQHCKGKMNSSSWCHMDKKHIEISLYT